MRSERMMDTTGVSAAEEHSSPGEALPEFDAFLAQIGYGHLYRFREDEVRVDEVAQAPIVPARKETTAAVPREGRGWVWALAMVLLAGAVLWTPLHQAYDKWTRMNAPASYEFLDRFDATRKGTKVGEVRDRLGLPTSRRAIVGPLNQEEWIYTSCSKENPSEKLLCILTVRVGRVMWKKKVAVGDTKDVSQAFSERMGDPRLQ